MSRFMPLAALLACWLAAGGSVAGQAGIGGDWNVTFETPQGPQTVLVTVKLDGEKATGQLTTPLGSVPISGTAGEHDFDLTALVDIQGVKFQLGLKGKADGDVLTGTVKSGEFGEFPFTGKRAPAAAAETQAPGTASAGDLAANAVGGATGTWQILLSLAGNPIEATARLKQEGDKVSGTLTNQLGDVPVTGTMTGTELKLEFTAQTPSGPLPIIMTGSLGATGFAGKLTITGIGEADWTGKRAN